MIKKKGETSFDLNAHSYPTRVASFIYSKKKRKETYIIHHEAIQLQLLADRLVSFYNEKTNVEESCTPGGRHNAYTPPRWETSQDPNGSSCGA